MIANGVINQLSLKEADCIKSSRAAAWRKVGSKSRWSTMCAVCLLVEYRKTCRKKARSLSSAPSAVIWVTCPSKRGIFEREHFYPSNRRRMHWGRNMRKPKIDAVRAQNASAMKNEKMLWEVLILRFCDESQRNIGKIWNETVSDASARFTVLRWEICYDRRK